MPDAIDELFDRGVALHQNGQIEEANAIYEQVLVTRPRHIGAWHLSGVILHQQGRHVDAIAKIGQAIKLDSRQAVFFNNYGAALQSLGRWIEAIGCFQRAIAIRPKNVDAHSNLGNALEKLGQPREAESHLRRALELNPEHFDSLRRLANLLVRLGKRQEADHFFERALKLQPENADLLAEAGNCCLSDSRPADAMPLYERALATAPDNPATSFNLGSAYADQDLFADAKRCFERACQLSPRRKAWPLRTLSLSPAAFESVEALDHYRADLEQRVEQLIDQPPTVTPADLLSVGFMPPFGLAFQGRNDRRIKEKFAALARHWIKPLNLPGSGGKPRIGFVVTRGHEGLFLRCMAGVLERLDPDKLDVLLVCPECSEDRLKKGIARKDLKAVSFPENIDEAVTRIGDARFDLLYFWEVGSDALNYLLPFFRLAPVQVTSWGTQVTSGVKEIDYYLSGDLIELPTADEHYTEKLVRMKCLLTYQRRLPQPPATPKSYFGIDDCRHVYLCPQNVLKLHPEQDPIFADLLRRDPQGVLVFKEGKHKRPTQVLAERMQKAMPDVFERIVFVPWQSREDYYRLISMADVVLDPLHFSAGSSSYDMWSFNQPVVTLPGQFNVGRYTQACYRQMEMPNLIAQAAGDYVLLANRLASDVDFAETMRVTLGQRTPSLFESNVAVRDFEGWFLQVVEDK